LQGRSWATLRREIRPADSSTFKCEEIVGCVSEKWPTRSDTDASPRARRTTIPRRVGSARAAKARSSCFMLIDYCLYRLLSMDIPRCWKSAAGFAGTTLSISRIWKSTFAVDLLHPLPLLDLLRGFVRTQARGRVDELRAGFAPELMGRHVTRR